MIANAQELQTVLGQLRELTSQRDTLLRDRTMPPFELHVELAGLEKMMARLQDEIDAYEEDQSVAGTGKEIAMARTN